MYYRLTVENLSDRIFNITQQEVHRRDKILRVVDSIGTVKILLLTCDEESDIASVVTTLETDKNATVMFVQDSGGTQVNFRKLREQQKPYFNRHTLSISAMGAEHV